MKSLGLLLLLITTLLLTNTLAMAKDEVKRHMVGGYAPIPDLKEKHVLRAAQFALSKVDSQASYSFQVPQDAELTVVDGYRQVVAGMNYQLVLVVTTTKDKEFVGAFEVTVYDHFGDLTTTKWGSEKSREEAMIMMDNLKESGQSVREELET